MCLFILHTHLRLTVNVKWFGVQFYTLNIYILVPPHQILVYDASGRDVAGAVGPLFEGDNIVLTCEVRGGK